MATGDDALQMSHPKLGGADVTLADFRRPPDRCKSYTYSATGDPLCSQKEEKAKVAFPDGRSGPGIPVADEDE